MHAIPLLALGAVVLFSSSKKKKKQKALPESSELESPIEGKSFSSTIQVYAANDVHMIDARVGEEFGVALPYSWVLRALGFDWELQAVPPKQNLNFLRKDMYNDTEVFFFKAKQKGHGSVVFHLHKSQNKHLGLPESVSEIKVEIK